MTTSTGAWDKPRAASLASLLQREGLVLARNSNGEGHEVIGDPCVVWDDDADGWRMILFYQPPGHGESVSPDLAASPGTWSEPVPLRFSNPERFVGNGTHKPFLVQDPHRPGRPAFVDDHYWLYTVDTVDGGREKQIHRARATSLAGPWTLDADLAIPRGEEGAFDSLHVDVPTAFYFPELGEFVCFYMGYPDQPRADLPGNPFASSIGVALQRPDEPTARKQGIVLDPVGEPGHWAAGYLGGIQPLPGVHHRWVAVVNASPTAPTHDGSLTAEEPAPSLGGLAYCDEAIPLTGWRLADQPLEWIDEIPPAALAAGEGTNLWRHHALVLGDVVRIFYNSGFYGQEQLYSKTASAADLGIAAQPAPTLP